MQRSHYYLTLQGWSVCVEVLQDGLTVTERQLEEMFQKSVSLFCLHLAEYQYRQMNPLRAVLSIGYQRGALYTQRCHPDTANCCLVDCQPLDQALCTPWGPPLAGCSPAIRSVSH